MESKEHLVKLNAVAEALRREPHVCEETAERGQTAGGQARSPCCSRQHERNRAALPPRRVTAKPALKAAAMEEDVAGSKGVR